MQNKKNNSQHDSRFLLKRQTVINSHTTKGIVLNRLIHYPYK